MAKKSTAELPMLEMESAAAWEAWLEQQHGESKGVWLRLAKKGKAVGVSYAEAVEEALCFGWIDGQAKPLDESWWIQRFTPRTSTSKWSKVNCGKVEALVKAGKMKAAGLKQVEAAKADGRWERAYASPSSIEVPKDLQVALDAEPKAAVFFAQLTGANRYAVLYRIHEAKKAETRARRIEKFVAMMVEGKTLH